MASALAEFKRCPTLAAESARLPAVDKCGAAFCFAKALNRLCAVGKNGRLMARPQLLLFNGCNWIFYTHCNPFYPKQMSEPACPVLNKRTESPRHSAKMCNYLAQLFGETGQYLHCLDFDCDQSKKADNGLKFEVQI